MIGLSKCNGSCSTVADLSKKICISSKTENVNVAALKR